MTSLTYHVVQLYADGSESDAFATDFKVLEAAIRKADVVAKKWRKVMANGRPRKLDRVPTLILVRSKREGSVVHTSHHVVEVRQITAEELLGQ